MERIGGLVAGKLGVHRGAIIIVMNGSSHMSEAFTKKSDKNYITPVGLQRLRDELRFLLGRERPAVTQVVAWAASNGDRSDNADYRYGKRRVKPIPS